jgi:hypothetical protein
MYNNNNDDDQETLLTSFQPKNKKDLVDKKVTGNSLRGHWARRFIVQGCEAAAAHKKWRKPFGVTTTTTTGKNKKKGVMPWTTR